MAEKQLFTVIDVPEIKINSTVEKQSNKRTIKFDRTKGDFILTSTGQIAESNDQEAYINWCYKICQTERFTCLAYPNSIGVEAESAQKEQSEKAIESAIERTITEALLVHPRTEYVRGFIFSWNGDTLYCSCTVKGKELESFQLDLKY